MVRTRLGTVFMQACGQDPGHRTAVGAVGDCILLVGIGHEIVGVEVGVHAVVRSVLPQVKHEVVVGVHVLGFLPARDDLGKVLFDLLGDGRGARWAGWKERVRSVGAHAQAAGPPH